MAAGITNLTKATDAGSPLFNLNLMASRMRNKGIMAIAEAMTQGGMTRLQKLNLSSALSSHTCAVLLPPVVGRASCHRACRAACLIHVSRSHAIPRTRWYSAANNIQQKGMAIVSKTLACKRHRGLLDLDLSYNAFGDPGMEQLSEAIAMGACPALERLRIACALSTEALPRLAPGVSRCDAVWCVVCILTLRCWLRVRAWLFNSRRHDGRGVCGAV